MYRFHPFPKKGVVSGFLDSPWVPGFTMGSWIHDGFLDSQWVPGFMMGSWIHDWFWDEVKAARSAALNFYYLSLSIYSQTELAMRGSNGIGKGP